ncbi:deoxyribonuclease V [Xanthomonas oryzae pv. oryzicola]|uniref:deoxyribonuclease V n=1 Tax=Xanthomonas oryzae TaxID=347 RepID=UPI000464F7B4|nr:deoxyribonuclease V [Xanthomonas oryzae]AJQ88301.1 endonuclease V [Xanthomonas oryzae pv. oryzicola]AKO06604.1 endonuclease V [Xanthomonas oryzae pv. oryzicola]AKO10520.1 endonuclease V [Xanthomonas oryzae pv. oryzicola]OWB17736.1 endonuclease V [Xanthomonas oryzae pv. oryzicola]OWB29222.1 endonuclease V [Xanthomonas oryzae pv. oryzicola]
MHTNGSVFAGWDGSVIQAQQLQHQLAQRVLLHDEVSATPQLLAGFDVGFEDDGQTTRAAAVLLDAHTLLPLETHVARAPTSMPYVPGLLSFRELPALLQALARLSRTPDLVFIDGQGIAHPRRLGIAAHFGVVTGLPCISIAKQRLAGSFAEPGPERGDHTPILLGGAQIGWALRSKPRCNPLIVSPGHCVSMQGALGWTLRTLRSYRLPEPTRLADRLASQRGKMPALAADTPLLF